MYVFYSELGWAEIFHSKDYPEIAKEPGWYWWSCHPGCLPDSDPIGPFQSAEEAEEDFLEPADWLWEQGSAPEPQFRLA